MLRGPSRDNSTRMYGRRAAAPIADRSSACQTGASCAGTADEAKTTIAYQASNLRPISVTSGNGSGALSATTAMSYDAIGNLKTVDGPLPGSADTTTYRYDAARQLVGVVAPSRSGKRDRESYTPIGSSAVTPSNKRITIFIAVLQS